MTPKHRKRLRRRHARQGAWMVLDERCRIELDRLVFVSTVPRAYLFLDSNGLHVELEEAKEQ